MKTLQINGLIQSIALRIIELTQGGDSRSRSRSNMEEQIESLLSGGPVGGYCKFNESSAVQGARSADCIIFAHIGLLCASPKCL